MPESWKGIETVKISALYNKGIDKLNSVVTKIATDGLSINSNSSIIPNMRHKIEIEKCLETASRTKEGLKNETSFELIAIDLKEAIDSLGEIIGVSIKEEILDKIFSRFCIGK